MKNENQLNEEQYDLITYGEIDYLDMATLYTLIKYCLDLSVKNFYDYFSYKHYYKSIRKLKVYILYLNSNSSSLSKKLKTKFAVSAYSN